MKKILVVDDSKIIREKFVEYLKSSGYETVTAENGKESVEKVKEELFDLILMDLLMPVMDGFEAIRRIRDMNSLPFIPIIVVSNLESQDDLKKALKLGADEYISKPIGDVAFIARIQAMLRLKDFYEKAEALDRKYETLLQSLPDVVYKLDARGNFVFISDSIESLGFKPQEIIGRHFSEIVHPDDVPLVSRSIVLPKYAGKATGDKNAPKLFDERRSKDRGTKNLEVRLVSKGPAEERDDLSGLSVVVTMAFGEVASACLRGSQSKETIETVGMIRDVTERKQEEKTRKQLYEELEEKVQELEIFKKVTMGREKRVSQLRKEVKELKKRLGGGNS